MLGTWFQAINALFNLLQTKPSLPLMILLQTKPSLPLMILLQTKPSLPLMIAYTSSCFHIHITSLSFPFTSAVVALQIAILNNTNSSLFCHLIY